MQENGGNSRQTEQNAHGSQTRLVLNLRRFQAQFLQTLAAAIELDISAICQRLIDHETASEHSIAGDILYSSSAQIALRELSSQNAGGGWTQVEIFLDPSHFDSLCARAADSKVSSSTVMRHHLARCMERHGFAASGEDQHSDKSLLSGWLRHIPSKGLIAMMAGATLVVTVIYLALPDGKSIEVGPHWAGTNSSLILDHHTHTTYSDGQLSPTELVELANDGGCDALAVTDHSDGEGTLNDQQLLEMQTLRDKYPDLLLFNGIELNMPSYGGREHAGLIAAPSVDVEVLRQLRDLAERSLKRAKKGGGHKAFDMELLKIISEYQSLHNGMLLIYNHPSREDAELSENFTDIVRWNEKGNVFTAIEGAPGHQKAPAIGSYRDPHLTQDRWDPVVAMPGGEWDKLLSSGHQVWAALATSSYQNDSKDNPPCSFSRTHLMVPEESYRGILMALKAGTFWADHGQILNQLWFSVDVEGLEQSAHPGYTVDIGDKDSAAVATIRIERGPGSFGQPLSAEFIGNCRTGDGEILAVEEIPANSSEATTSIPLENMGADGRSCTLRARVRLSRNAPTDFLAYTNPIRFILD